MTIKNGDMPAMPFEEVRSRFQGLPDKWSNHVGLTKREMFCLHMGVAETGDAELDAIIRKGNRQKMAAHIMQSVVASKHKEISWWPELEKRQAFAHSAVGYADELIAELEKNK